MRQADITEKGFEASSNLSAETDHAGKDIRPCIASLIETPLRKGEFPNRNMAAVVIASELKRIGLDYDTIRYRLDDWNQYNDPPLRPTDLDRASNNAWVKDYRYSCRHAALSSFCVGQEICPFSNRVRSKICYKNDRAFIDFGWPGLLSNRQTLIYAVALPHLEISRQVGRGGLICASHRQIAEACGISRETVGKDLGLLDKVGLIEYESGTPRKWEGKASEIRRVFPIPRPRREIADILKGHVRNLPPIKSGFLTT